MTVWRSGVLACFSAALLCLLLAAPRGARAADAPAIPHLWDSRDPPPKPDARALPRLRFLTTDDFPPFNGRGGDGKLAGFNIDLAHEICGELGLADRCSIEARRWDDLQAALDCGEGDAIIAGIAVSARTRAALGFSRPYLLLPARFVMRKGDGAAEPLWQALRGSPVGVVAGTSHERFLRENFGDSAVTPFPDMRAMLDALAGGRVRAAFGDGMRLSSWLNEAEGGDCCRFAGGPYLGGGAFGSGLTVATRWRDDAMRGAMDYALHGVAARRKLDELYLKWFPVGFF